MDDLWLSRGIGAMITAPSMCPIEISTGRTKFLQYAGTVTGPDDQVNELETLGVAITDRNGDISGAASGSFIGSSPRSADIFGGYLAGQGGG
ncbi:MAG: hypothetical protein ACREL6_05600, partial [Gemmatimonadales bacterium]